MGIEEGGDVGSSAGPGEEEELAGRELEGACLEADAAGLGDEEDVGAGVYGVGYAGRMRCTQEPTFKFL